MNQDEVADADEVSEFLSAVALVKLLIGVNPFFVRGDFYRVDSRIQIKKMFSRPGIFYWGRGFAPFVPLGIDATIFNRTDSQLAKCIDFQ